MSWGSETASAADTASTVGDTASTASTAADAAGNVSQAAPVTSGFEIGPQMTTDQAANFQTYGTASPSFMDKAGAMYDRFTNGQNASLGNSMKNFGNNPETYGKVYGILTSFAKGGGGGGGSVQPASITNYYQQPQNEYLRKRGY